MLGFFLCLQAKEWLCLNCQMQRALGASEPPGLPMMTHSSPSRDIPANIQKKESPTAGASKQEISEPVTLGNGIAKVTEARETELCPVSEPAKEVSNVSPSIHDKPGPPAASKADLSPASQKPCSDELKVLPDAQLQTQRVPISSQPAVPTDKAKGESPQSQHPPKAGPPLDKPTALSEQKEANQPPMHPSKLESSPSKSALPPPVLAAKPESGILFGFGGPKTQPTKAKTAESVTGKMFGFGSSFLNSASNLITSAVQDETKTTPPTSRKMSTTDRVSTKPTPPSSPKTLPAKDAKTTSVEKTEDKTSQKTEQSKMFPTEQLKATKSPSDVYEVPQNRQDDSRSQLSMCPLCKIKLNFDSNDPKNYNTCTQCKSTVCNQCGFDAISTISEVSILFTKVKCAIICFKHIISYIYKNSDYY